MADLFKFGMQPMGPEEAPQDPFGNLDPIVAQYMRNKYSVADARNEVDTTNKIAGAVQLGDVLANATSRPTVLQNRMQDLGKAPTVIEPQQYKNDVSGLQKQAQMKLAQATSDEDNAVKMAFEQRKAELAQKAAAKKAEEDARRFQMEYDQKERGIQANAASKNAYAEMMGGIKQQTMEDRKEREAAKIAADQEALKIEGFGYANNADDAKQLKDGVIAKSNFDNKLQQLVDLRTAKDGGAIWDREAVARAKQLSKDLLLEYKNMQKLGVLSQSDESIINAIIPSDPLEYNSPIAAIQGQDPILNNMKQFKGDTDKDFQTRLKMRLKGGNSETKVINGATYRKVQGGWQKVK